METNNKKGYVYLFPTFFIWGSVYVVSKYALETVPPITVLLIRYLLSVVLLAFICKKQGNSKLQKHHIKYFVLIGILGYFLSLVFQLLGTKLLDASLSSLINAMNPVSMSIFAVIFLKEKVTLPKIGSILLSIIGVYIILGVGGQNISIPGVICAITSVLLWSAATIIIRKITDEYTPIQIALYSIIAALIFNIPASLWEVKTTPCTFTLPAVLSILYMGIVCTTIAHTLWNKSLQLLDASTCSMFYPLQPLVSAVMGIIFLHEQITFNFVIGSVIICLGILIAVATSKK